MSAASLTSADADDSDSDENGHEVLYLNSLAVRATATQLSSFAQLIYHMLPEPDNMRCSQRSDSLFKNPEQLATLLQQNLDSVDVLTRIGQRMLHAQV